MKSENCFKWIFSILFLLTSVGGSLAQSEWKLSLPPAPTSNQLVSLDFIDATTGWAVGEYGTIVKSTDGGSTWRLIEIPELNYLRDVHFPSAITGYIVGTDGIILKSVNGGETWMPQTTPFTNDLNRVRFRDERTGWIVGEKGLILYTNDGGENWVQQQSNCRADLQGLALAGAGRVCVVGCDTTILMTEDDGNRWEQQLIDSRAQLDFKDVFFLDESNGWAGGKFNILFKTRDGGATWTKMKIDDCDYQDFNFKTSGLDGVQQIAFLNQTDGVCLIDYPSQPVEPYHHGNIPLATRNQGRDWGTEIFGSKEYSAQPGRLACLPDNRIVNTGYGGEFRCSDDLGWTWHYTNEAVRAFSYLFVADQGALFGIRQVSKEVRVWNRSEDFGRNWAFFKAQFYDQEGSLQSGVGLGKCHYVEAEQALYTVSRVGGKMTSYKSSDTGLTWRMQQSDLEFIFRNTATFLTADTLIAYDMRMVRISNDNFQPELQFYRSFDGGKTEQEFQFSEIWNIGSAYELGTAEKFVAGHYFFNGHTGFLVGTDGNIIKTTDTGESWENIPSGVVENLWDITFIDDQTGFVVGEFGRILKTEDGGQTWRKTQSATQENVYAIGFKTDTEGWAGTETGLLHTIDAGETWEKLPLRYFHGKIREIEFDPSGNGYAFTYHSNYPEEILISSDRPDGYIFLLALPGDAAAVGHEPAKVPVELTLFPNYPNPFNSQTCFQFALSQTGAVTLGIYNIQGQLVRTVLDKTMESGVHEVAWDGRNDTGQSVASGVYLVRLIGGGMRLNQKLVVLR